MRTVPGSAARDRAPTIAAAFLLIVACALGIGAWQLARAQSQDRRDARDRYSNRAGVASALTDSLFDAAFRSSASQATLRFGGARVSDAALDRQAARNDNAYVAILDASGRRLGASQRTPSSIGGGLQRFMRRALRPGQSQALSDVTRDREPLVLAAVPFTAADRTRRLIVSASPAQAYIVFLSGALRPLAPIQGGDAFVFDRAGAVLGAVGSANTGTPRPDDRLARLAALDGRGTYSVDGSERYFSSAAIPGTDWRIVLRVPTKALYASLGGPGRWLPWAILALAACALGAVALLLRRVVAAGARVARAHAELERSEQQLRERALQLQDANAELRRSNEDLEQFAYVASHDLSAPLRGIAGFSQLLGRRYHGRLDAQADEFIDHMQDGVSRMQRIIDDLLLYSRVDRNELEAEDVALDDVLERTLRTIDDHGGRVTHDPLPVVRGEPGQLAQVLQNLVTNGLKFCAPGVEPRVHVGARRDGERWRIEVRDNGIGIAAEDTETIFKMFHRLQTPTDYPGTGIGLAIAKKIVERHGGTISAFPAEGGGTVVAVVLAAAAEQPRHEHEPVVA